MSDNKFKAFFDGYARAGKNRLVESLIASGFFGDEDVLIFNTGDMFRAVAWEALCHNIPPGSKDYDAFILRAMTKTDFFSINRENLFCNPVDKTVPYVGAVPGVKEAFFDAVPQIIQSARQGVVLTMGRRLGERHYESNANIYIDTSLETCAHRNGLEAAARGSSYDEGYQLAMQRNLKDIAVGVSAAEPIKTSFIVNGELSPDEVLEQTIDYLTPLWKNYKGITQ